MGCQAASIRLLLTTFPSFLSFSDPAIVNGVYWSESLNKVFVDNFDRDPSLIWQYFGSAKGFFRQYPGEYDCIENCDSGEQFCNNSLQSLELKSFISFP